MAIDFKLPDLGENIESGDVVEVLVKEGDTIKPEQEVIELETEKAVMPVPCPRIVRVVARPRPAAHGPATAATNEAKCERERMGRPRRATRPRATGALGRGRRGPRPPQRPHRRPTRLRQPLPLRPPAPRLD